MAKNFHIYRFQVLPIDRRQLSLFDKNVTIEELRANKNKHFWEVFEKLLAEKFVYEHHILKSRTLYKDNNILIFQLAINRGRVPVEMPDFTEERFDNYPNFIVGVNNDPKLQYIFIEREYKAFRHTHIAANMLQENLNRELLSFHLHTEVNALFSTSEFWELVEKYPNIYRAEFEMVAPNLADIHGALEDSLRKWFPATNSQKIEVSMSSDKQASLELKKGAEPTTSFVNYASKGGGNITVKAKELKYKLSTKDSVTQVVCKDLQIDADGAVRNLDELIELLKTKDLE